MNHLKTLAGNKQIESIHGVLKSSPDDFVVDELPLYEPCGEGEHLYLVVRKKNMSHDELIRQIAQEFEVSKRSVGAAGRKDLRAVISQTISVHLPGKNIIAPEEIGSIEVVSSSWHTNKLRLGHLKGNKFTIRLREIEMHQFGTIEANLEAIANAGLPNAFGPQRFGNKNNNHTLGLFLVLEQWDSLIEELLKGDDRHHDFAQNGEFKKAIDAWPFGQPAERNVLEALAQGKSTKQACKTISRQLQILWVNAFQSSLFNEVLQRRKSAGTWSEIIEGDLVWNHEGGGRTFELQQDEIESDDIKQRLSSFALSPSGPLWGSKMRMPSGAVLQLEQEVLSSFGVTEAHLDQMKKMASGARRPLRVPVEQHSITSDTDSDGEYIEVTFELPAGSFATVLVKEILAV